MRYGTGSGKVRGLGHGIGIGVTMEGRQTKADAGGRALMGVIVR